MLYSKLFIYSHLLTIGINNFEYNNHVIIIYNSKTIIFLITNYNYHDNDNITKCIIDN